MADPHSSVRWPASGITRWQTSPYFFFSMTASRCNSPPILHLHPRRTGGSAGLPGCRRGGVWTICGSVQLYPDSGLSLTAEPQVGRHQCVAVCHQESIFSDRQNSSHSTSVSIQQQPRFERASASHAVPLAAEQRFSMDRSGPAPHQKREPARHRAARPSKLSISILSIFLSSSTPPFPGKIRDFSVGVLMCC